MADKFLDQIKEDLQTIKNIWIDNDKNLKMIGMLLIIGYLIICTILILKIFLST